MAYREQIPIDKGVDNTLKILTEGYNYITNQRLKYGRDIFETRILGGQKAICIAGEEAVMIFYNEEKIIRKNAAPKRIRQTLFGERAIQTLDGEKHRHRKELFMSLMSTERLTDIRNIFENELEQVKDKWSKQTSVVLYKEMVQILTKVACEWAGVPLGENEVNKRSIELEALFDGAGAVGVRHWKGRTSRNLAEKWLQDLVRQVRDGELNVPSHSALYKMSWYQDKDGKLLNEEIVAVELLNILRPIVAVSVYITFIALALHDYPSEKEKVQQDGEEYSEFFIQEVRRFYPFFPSLIGRVREDFLWNGHDFRKGNLVMLDLYGTNHHPDIWKEPHTFNPERFRNREENFYDFLPQGGGDYYRGHRCPGEWLTIEVMKTALSFLVNRINYTLPDQNLEYSMTRYPSLPKSGVIISNVKTV